MVDNQPEWKAMADLWPIVDREWLDNNGWRIVSIMVMSDFLMVISELLIIQS